MVQPAYEHDPDEDHDGKRGESPDTSHTYSLKIVHQLIDKFPALKNKGRYKWFIGTTAVVAPLLIGTISLVVARRIQQGHSPEKILNEVTEEEIEGVGKEKRKKTSRRVSQGRITH